MAGALGTTQRISALTNLWDALLADGVGAITDSVRQYLKEESSSSMMQRLNDKKTY